MLVAPLLSIVATASTTAPPQVCAQYGAEGRTICATELFFDQQLDHFRFSAASVATFKHRYLENTDSWGKPTGTPLQLPDGCPGPVLLYTGNEGPIDAFWGSNGFMVNHLAPTWGAALLFPEERYYGKSAPFGPTSLEPEQAAFMTTEQVLADYATVLTSWKEAHNATTCPVLAFGGSYGGTLTTYFRRVYPALTCGGLAASAPIGYYSKSQWASHGVSQFTWIDIVQRVFSTTQHGGVACFDTLKKSVEAVAALGATADGRKTLATQLHLCSEAVLGTDPTNFLIDALETLPQMDYPYAIGSIPGWPVNATCATAAATADPIALASKVIDMFYGYDGTHCLDGEGQGGIPGGGPGPASWGPWGYQSCTETLHQFSSSASGHGFRNFTFSTDAAASTCQNLYKVQPNPRWAEQRWGGFHIGDGHTGVNHLIWSNGGLDPWHGGGFLTPIPNDDELHWFFMPQGAHHLDLRGPHPEDPPNVTATRAAEEAILKGWIESCPQLG